MVYQNLRDSVDSWLSQHHLLYRMHLPITTTQIALITSITTAMETSPLQYQFPTPRDNTLAPHESLSLQQLGLSAKGAPRTNGQIYLRPRPMKSGTVLADLITDRPVYSGKPCIEGDEWGLYFGKLDFSNMIVTSHIVLIFFTFSNFGVGRLRAGNLCSRSFSSHMPWILVLSQVFRRYGDVIY